MASKKIIIDLLDVESTAESSLEPILSYQLDHNSSFSKLSINQSSNNNIDINNKIQQQYIIHCECDHVNWTGGIVWIKCTKINCIHWMCKDYVINFHKLTKIKWKKLCKDNYIFVCKNHGFENMSIDELCYDSEIDPPYNPNEE